MSDQTKKTLQPSVGRAGAGYTARREGWDAYHAGLSLSANPHDGVNAYSWKEGHRAAEEGERWDPEPFEPGTRYRVVEGSQSSHCCFEATVIDMGDPEYHPSEGYFVNRYADVCECFDRDDAERIARALNADRAV